MEGCETHNQVVANRNVVDQDVINVINLIIETLTDAKDLYASGEGAKSLFKVMAINHVLPELSHTIMHCAALDEGLTVQQFAYKHGNTN